MLLCTPEGYTNSLIRHYDHHDVHEPCTVQCGEAIVHINITGELVIDNPEDIWETVGGGEPAQ
jgi:hypothetical protein